MAATSGKKHSETTEVVTEKESGESSSSSRSDVEEDIVHQAYFMSFLGALGNWLFSFFPKYLLERWNGARFTEHEEDKRENDVEGDGEVNSENNAAESNQCLQESGGQNMVNIHVHNNSGVVVIGDKSSINPPQVVHNVPQPSSVSLNELHENTGQQKKSKSAESSALQEAEVQHTSSTNALLPANINKQGNENKIVRKKKKAAGKAIVRPKIPSLIRRFEYIQKTLSQYRGKGEWKTHRETIERLMKEYKNDDDNYDIVLFLEYEKAISFYQMNDRRSSCKLLCEVAGKIDQSTVSETQTWIYVRCFLFVSDIYCQIKRFGKAKKALDEAKTFLVKFASINQAFLETEFHLAYARYYLEQVEQVDHYRQSCVEYVIEETKKAEKVAKKDSSEMWKELHMEILMTRSNAILKLSHINPVEHDEHNEMLKKSLEEMDYALYNKSLPITKVKFRSLKCCYYKMLGNLEQAVEQAKEGLEIAGKCEFHVEIKQLERQIKDIENSLSVDSKLCMEIGEVVRKVAHMNTTDTGNVESNAVEQSCGGAFSTDDFTTDDSSDNEERTPKLKSICGRNEVLECFHDPVQGHPRSREKMDGNYSSCQDLVTHCEATSRKKHSEKAEVVTEKESGESSPSSMNDVKAEASVPCSRERKDAVDSGISGLSPLSRYSSRISPFRCFLKQLVDNLSSDDVNKICSELKLPGRLLTSQTWDGLSLLVYLEENGYFTESSFLGLKDVLIEVSRMDLVHRIEVFLRFQGKTSWFKENLLNQDFNLNDDCQEFLKRLPWVEAFGIAGRNKKFESLHLEVTCTYGQTPVLDNLTEQFGNEIGKFVEFIEGVEHPNFSFLCSDNVVSSGDGIHIWGHEPTNYGSVGIFAYEVNGEKNHFASTCYHVLYPTELAEDGKKRYKQLFEDCCDESSDTRHQWFKHLSREAKKRECQEVGEECGEECEEKECGEKDECKGKESEETAEKFFGKVKKSGGKFRAKFNEEHDFALLLVSNEFERHSLNEDINSSELISDMEIPGWLHAKGEIPVEKTGYSTDTTRGILRKYSYTADCFNYKNGYLIGDADPKKPFLKRGDSGALVKLLLDNENRYMFAYVVGQIEPGKYFCFNLKKSFEEYKQDLKPCLKECQERNT